MQKQFPEHFALRLAACLSLAVIGVTGCNRDPNVRKQKYLESGKRYANNGKTNEAAIQFSNALKVDRNYADAHFELAKLYLGLGNAMVAYSELQKTVDLAPSNIQARIDLGDLELASGLPDQAMQQGNAVLALDANNADAYALLCGIAVQKGDRAAALQQIQRALKIDPIRPAFHTTLALLQESDPDGVTIAEQELEKAISLDSRYERAHLILASLFEHKGDRTAAEREGLAAIALAPKDMQARQALAGFYLRGGDSARTEQVLRQATEDFSDTDRGALLLSDYYVRTGQLDKAETVYAQLASKYPKSAAIKFAYGGILVVRHEDGKAAAVARELDKSAPNTPHSQLLDASLLLNDGKTADAFTLLQKAVKDYSNDTQLQIALGKVSLQQKDLATAETSFRAALRLDPESLDAVAGLAEVANKKQDQTLLLQMAEKALTVDVNYPDAFLWRGAVEANRQQYANAEADLRTALSKSPQNAPVYVQLGLLRLKEGNRAEGAAMLEKALAIEPGSNTAMQILIENDLAMKQPAKAIERVKQQIAKVPRNEGFYIDLAQLQLNSADFSGARDSAQKAMQLDPADPLAVQFCASATSAAGDVNGAIGLWRQWTATHPNDGNAVTVIGELEERKGDPRGAMEDYRKALQLDPKQPVAANNLAYLMVENGQNVDTALNLAQQARQALPNSPDTADTLAWVFYYKGRYASARDLLEDALKADGDNASAHYHLGMTYLKMGDKTAAAMHLKKAAAQTADPIVRRDATEALAHMA